MHKLKLNLPFCTFFFGHRWIGLKFDRQLLCTLTGERLLCRYEWLTPADFNQHLGCTAPKRWLKYTTPICSIRTQRRDSSPPLSMYYTMYEHFLGKMLKINYPIHRSPSLPYFVLFAYFYLLFYLFLFQERWWLCFDQKANGIKTKSYYCK